MMCRCLTQMFTVPPLNLLSKSPELIKTNNQTSERARTGAQMLAPPSRTAVMRTTARGITCRGRRIPRRDHRLAASRSQSLVSLQIVMSCRDNGWAMSRSLFIPVIVHNKLQNKYWVARPALQANNVGRYTGNDGSRTMHSFFNAHAALVKSSTLRQKHQLIWIR